MSKCPRRATNPLYFSLVTCGQLLLAASAAHAHSGQAHESVTTEHDAPPHRTQSAVIATQITPSNAAHLMPQGPDAISGVNDWLISNGTLCAVVSDLDHEGEFSTRGGSLVDLGFCNRADDHYNSYYDLLQGSRLRPLDGQTIRIQQTSDSASIIVDSTRDGAVMQTEYRLSTTSPTQLHIQKRLSKADDLNFYSTLNFNYHSLESFVFSSKNPRQSTGFQNEDFVSRGQSAISVAARHADTIITVSPPDAEHGISYGWQLLSAERVSGDDRYPVPHFVLADDSSNAMLILSDTFYIGDGSSIGWLQMPQLLLLDLDQDAIETKEIIYVGKRGDVASITDQLLTDTTLVSGQITEANAALHIWQDNGQPLTHVRPDHDGRFTLRIPRGRYRFEVRGSASRTISRDIEIGATAITLDTFELPTTATIKLPQGQPMRLVFEGLDGTPNPNFADTLTGSSVRDDDGETFLNPVPQLFLAGVEGDPVSVKVAPGKYRVYATHGPEHDLQKVEIEVGDDSLTTLEIAAPKRQIATPGYIASDLHVHSGVSFDNAFSETERVRTFVAENGEVMVSSEHDIPVDYAPRIEALGVQNKITSIAAAEVTSLLPTELNPYTSGHANFFPYQPDPLAFRRGMINHENRRWRNIIHDIKQQQPDVVVQLNHPRLDLRLSGKSLPSDWQEIIDNGQFLDHMGSAGHPYNPHLPLSSAPNNVLIEPDPVTGMRDIDFDLIEVINPGGEHHEQRIRAIRQDWLSLLKQGEKLVATANSDSHRSDVQVAVPRTMVNMSNDQVTAFNQAEFLRSLKAGNVYGTTGPMLEISLGDKVMGEMFSGQRGQLSLKVFSTDWIPVNLLKLQINGVTIEEYSLDSNKTEHTLLIPMSFDQDAFVTVEISGPAEQDYAAIYPGMTPYAFSNPIYIDYDGDGKWTPPGL
ncbi:CehA/McbA family metallohydrolase [Arenicella xantha]|uniref:Carboxypeptidase family protein n=1 Tax=Arenicella xantha TaxID=644221 RepID=A0A395JNS7_9GAMM|nr:CehA/McbA family metallohydrolase [Arenicella xantha]RBP53301.1 hypothetical protein DFR28_101687 [Arenicella xantha]